MVMKSPLHSSVHCCLVERVCHDPRPQRSRVYPECSQVKAVELYVSTFLKWVVVAVSYRSAPCMFSQNKNLWTSHHQVSTMHSSASFLVASVSFQALIWFVYNFSLHYVIPCNFVIIPLPQAFPPLNGVRYFFFHLKCLNCWDFTFK